MSKKEKRGKAFGKLLQKRRLSVRNADTDVEELHVILTPAGILAVVTAFVVIVFAAVLALLAYTPVTDLLPGYKSEALRSREFMMQNIMRVDSLEHIMNDMMAYNENIAGLVGGRTPAVKTTIATDSTFRSKSIVAPSAEDSLLRAQMTGDSPYSLNNTLKNSSRDKREKTELTIPVEGIVTEHFDLRNGLYGVRLATASAARVTATAEGSVITSMWTPDNGYMVQIQHPDGLLSVYSNLQQTLVAAGQVVRASEVIGYTADQPSSQSDKLFEFQLWSNGQAVDPETYIVF